MQTTVKALIYPIIIPHTIWGFNKRFPMEGDAFSPPSPLLANAPFSQKKKKKKIQEKEILFSVILLSTQIPLSIALS